MTTNPLDSAAGISNFKKYLLLAVAVAVALCAVTSVAAYLAARPSTPSAPAAK